MQKSEIINLLKLGIVECLAVEHDILVRGRSERLFSTKLASILQDELLLIDPATQLKIDPFYNKHKNGTKAVGEKRGIELDLVIHNRGNDDDNVLALEMETNNSPERNDLYKLIGLTSPEPGEDHYGYSYGLFLVFGIKDQAGTILEESWYRRGVAVSGTPLIDVILGSAA